MSAGSRRGSQRLHFPDFPFDFGIKLRLVVGVIGEGGVDFGEGQVRVLAVDFVGGPAVGDLVEGDFDYLGVGSLNPGAALSIEDDV